MTPEIPGNAPPAQRQRGRVGGVVVVVSLGALCLLAALGTCRKFSEDHPASKTVRIESARTASAEFPVAGAEKIRAGMMALLSLDGSREKYLGRVVSVGRPEAVVAVSAVFPRDLPPAGSPGLSLAVDTTIPPELLRDQP